MAGFPNEVEIYTYEDFRRFQRVPAYAANSQAVPTIKTNAYYLERTAADDANVPGRPYYNGTSNPQIARTSGNSEIRGVILMDFRPNFIPVPGTPGLGAFVAYVPPDTVIDAPCPFGFVGWMSGGSL